MQLIDTHCHLDAPAFAYDRQQRLDAARAGGVTDLVVPAVTAVGWSNLLQLCQSQAWLWPALGLHPVMLAQHQPATDLEALAALLAQQRPIAVGEVGLDYAIADLDRSAQRALFTAQIALAKQFQLPLLLHLRKAYDEGWSLLRRAHFSEGGIVHAFNGSLTQAQRFIDLGFCLGFGGVATWPRAHHLQRLLQRLPIEALVLESDAPDLPPVWCRDGRNTPDQLPRIAVELARLRQQPVAQFAAYTSANARAVLRLPTAA